MPLTRDERVRGMERAGLAAMSTTVCDRGFLKGHAVQDTESSLLIFNAEPVRWNHRNGKRGFG